jgi:spore germination protein YaaH
MTEPTTEVFTYGDLFPLGQVVATSNLLNTIKEVLPEDEAREALIKLFQRHQSGDFGNVDSQDWHANIKGVQHGYRILSSYNIEGIKVWIITEGDRSVTTALLPEDY